MVNNPTIVVADEPTGNLDPETSESIMALLQEINKGGATVVVCTHDSNLVDRMKKRVIEIEDGLIIRDKKESGYRGDIETDRYGRKVPKQAHGSINLGRFWTKFTIGRAKTMY